MSGDDAQLARTYAELAKAEEQATLLEAQLTLLEGKLDLFLSEHGEDARSSETHVPATDDANGHVVTTSDPSARREEGENP